tara:strand:- start:785 stop:1735 length:951 start_codon:yes stop_codon:yes gene_type:complete
MKKLFFSISVAITLAFISVLIINNYSPHAIETNKLFKGFYEQEFNEKEEKIFLVGSSYVGVLNSEYILKKTLDNNNLKIYNLSVEADHPSRRISQIDDLISTKPDLVIYGVGLSDLLSYENIQKTDPILPEPKYYLDTFIQNNFGNIPQQFMLSKFILFKNIGLILNLDDNIMEYGGTTSPFINNTKFNHISNTEELEKNAILLTKNMPYLPHPESNYEYSELKKILQKFHNADIPVIIFSPPIHPTLSNLMDTQVKQNYDLILTDVGEEFNYSVYRLENEYSELDIWHSSDHISTSKTVTNYNEDIIKIINFTRN